MKEYQDYIKEISNAVEKGEPLTSLSFISNNDYDVLNLRDKTGVPVAFVASLNGHIFDDVKILGIQDSGNDNLRLAAEMADRNYKRYVHNPSLLCEMMARSGHVFDNMEIIKRGNVASLMLDNGADINEKTLIELSKNNARIAHKALSKGFSFETTEGLLLEDSDNVTIAHKMATNGHIFENMDVLMAKDKNGVSVAHIMAKSGYKFDNKEVLMLNDRFGNSVAHEQARHNQVFDDMDIISQKDRRGDSVGHIQAVNGWVSKDPNTLKITNDDGVSIAHILAKKNHAFYDESIYSLMDNKGKTVAYHMAKNGHGIMDANVLAQNYFIPSSGFNHNGKGRAGNHKDLISILEESNKFNFNIDEVKNNADILSIVSPGMKSPFLTRLYRDNGYIPSLDIAKEMNPNSLILFVENVLKYSPKEEFDKFAHLTSDKELMLKTNKKNYPISLAFSNCGFKSDIPEVIELLKPKSMNNWRDAVFPSGKFKGKKLGEIADSKPDYLEWCHKNNKYGIQKAITAEDIASLMKAPIKPSPSQKPIDQNLGNQAGSSDDWRSVQFKSGKNKDKTYGEILDINPTYMEWCHQEKKLDVHLHVPMEAIKSALESKKSNINVSSQKAAPKANNPVSENNWKEMEVTFGKHKGKTLGDLCESQKGYVTYLHGKGMKFIVDNVPSDIIVALNNNEDIKSYQDKKSQNMTADQELNNF